MEHALTDEQRAALEAACGGKSIFITGPGGTGKSFLLEALYRRMRASGRRIVVTALTGCAALLLGSHAKTLHSWAGIGLGRGSLSSMVQSIATNGRKKKNWKQTDCLVIDEVSMLTPKLLETLEQIGRFIRKDPRPFGGLQVIFVGDFHQLPPVAKEEMETQFAFQSPVWDRLVEATFPLTVIHRQRDPAFQEILEEARRGELSAASYQMLLARKTAAWKGQLIRPTLLFTRNADVNSINTTHLEKLTGEEHTFEARTLSKPQRIQEDILQLRIEKLDRDAPYETVLRLKVGAQVMLLKNTDPDQGLINGSRGVVKGFDPNGWPLVKFLSVLEPISVKPATWEDDGEGDVPVVREQIPLRLAYAVTIHKAQGASLDSALIDVGRATFEYGQAYVALSRVRSLDALWIYDIDPVAFRVHPAVKEFYSKLTDVVAEAAAPQDPAESAQFHDDPV